MCTCFNAIKRGFEVCDCCFTQVCKRLIRDRIMSVQVLRFLAAIVTLLGRHLRKEQSVSGRGGGRLHWTAKL